MANKFQASVGDIVLRNATTRQAIMHGKSNISTAMQMAMTNTEVRGGVGNALLYNYFHDRTVNFTIETPIWGENFLALQTGATIGTDTYEVMANECVVLSSGSATLDNTPVGNVTFLFDDNDASVLVTPTGDDIVVSDGADRKGVAVYDYNTSADRITVETATPPSTIELVMTANVYKQGTTAAVETFQVIVPNFQLDGSYDLTLGADAVSNQTLKGYALEVSSTDCTTGAYYYKATYISVSGTSSAYTQLASAPDPMSFSVAAGSATQQITVLGYKGVLHSAQALTDSCTYVRTSGCECINVGAATGLVSVTGSSMVDGDDAVIGVSYWDVTSGSLTDSLSVAVTA